MKTINKTTLFLILNFGMSFSLAGIFYLSGFSGANKTAFTVLGVLYMFMPTLSVLIVTKLIHKEPIKKDLLISFRLNKWFLLAWLLMPVISFCTVGVSQWFPEVSFNPEMTGMMKRFESMMTPQQMQEMKASLQSLPVHAVWIVLLQGLVAGITVNAVAAFGEELGWRGFLLRSFREMSFLQASLLIGFIWGIWHAPLILMGHNYPQHPVPGVFMMVVFCILLTPFLLYITLKARSVIAAAIFHGTLNATAGISIMLIDGGNDLTTGITGLAGFVTLFFFILLLFAYDCLISRERMFLSKMEKFL